MLINEIISFLEISLLSSLYTSFNLSLISLRFFTYVYNLLHSILSFLHICNNITGCAFTISISVKLSRKRVCLISLLIECKPKAFLGLTLPYSILVGLT